MTTTVQPSTAHVVDENLYATFLLDDLEFAIDVTYVRDAILRPAQIISLPASPEYIAGIIDLRDTIVPIIDTRKRFHMDNTLQEKQGGHIAITQCEGRYMGLTFDHISEVIRVKKETSEILAPEFQSEGDLLSEIIKLDDGKRLIQVINPLSLFDYKDLPAQFRQHVQRKEAGEAITARRQIVAFQVADQMFGIGVEFVREIIATPEITQRILVEEYIKGVISLRDELISIIDLHHFMADEPLEQAGESRIIILQINDLTFGILVDGIKEVITYEEKDLQTMPPWSGNRHDGGFSGVLEKTDYSIVLLDSEQLFSAAFKRVAEHADLHDTNKSTIQGIQQQGLEEGHTSEKQEKPPVTYITFELDEIYGVEITHIREIVRHQDNIRHLPGQVDYIEGILNLRSEVIPVINLRRFFKKPAAEIKETLIMIFTHNGRQVAILIDRLHEIRTFSESGQANIKNLLSQTRTENCQGLVERIVDIEDRQGNRIPTMILDVRQFINDMSESKSTAIEVEAPFTSSTETEEFEKEFEID